MRADPAATVTAAELVASCPGDDGEFCLWDGALGYVRLRFSDGSRGELRLFDDPWSFDPRELLGVARASLGVASERPLHLVS